MTKQEAIDKMILALTMPDKKGKENDFHEVAIEQGIDSDIVEIALNSMRNAKNYLAGGPFLNKCLVTVTKTGLEYANSLREKYYFENRIPIDPENTTDLPIEDTCEKIFQLHNGQHHVVVWKNSLFGNNPKNLHAAKMKMLNEGIIQPFDTTSEHRTILNSDYYSCSSYLECKRIREQQKSPVTLTTINTTGSNNTIFNNSGEFQINPEKPKQNNWFIRSLTWAGKIIAEHYIVIIVIPAATTIVGYKSCQKPSKQLTQPKTTESTLRHDSSKVSDSVKR